MRKNFLQAALIAAIIGFISGIISAVFRVEGEIFF